MRTKHLTQLTHPPETTPERLLIWRDKNGIINTIHDLEITCKYFNDAVRQLNEMELLPLGLTDEMVIGMCFNDPSAFIEALNEASTSAPNDNRFARRLTAKTLNEDKETVTRIINDLNDTMNKNRLRNGLCLIEGDRAIYLKAEKGSVTFDREDIKEYYSRFAEGKALDIVAEARKVFEILTDFDRKIRTLGANKVRGIGDAEAGAIPEIISVYDGKILLDLSAISDLDFNIHIDCPEAERTGIYIIKNPER